MTVTPDSVQELLSSEDFGKRLSGVNQLRQLEPATAFPLLQTMVNDSSVRVRYAAVSQFSSLGQQNLPLAKEILLRCLHEDPEPDVQAAAADSIGALKLGEALGDLQAVYERTPEWLVQFSIIAALGELGNQDAFGLLESAIQSDNGLVRTAAIGSLGELGNDRAVPLLLPFVGDADWQVRYRVAQALSHFSQPEAKAALETLAHDEIDSIAQEAKSHLG